MTEHALLGPWVRRFLLEHLVAERNLAANTGMSIAITSAIVKFESSHIFQLSPATASIFMTWTPSAAFCSASNVRRCSLPLTKWNGPARRFSTKQREI